MQNLSLRNVVAMTLISIIIRPFVRKESVKFPEEIEGYSFRKIFLGDKESRHYEFATYENRDGDIAIAKAWRGAVKDIGYHSLINQAVIQDILNKTLENKQQRLPNKFKKVVIPKTIAVRGDRRQLVVLSGFVKGVASSKLSEDISEESYQLARDFLRYMGRVVSPNDKKKIARRKISSIIFIYPILLIRAITLSPSNAPRLLKGACVFCSVLLNLHKNSKVVLSDRDLHPDNIIVSGNKIALIDLQYCMYSDELYDSIFILLGIWPYKNFRERQLKYIRGLCKRRDINNRVLMAFVVHVVTHGFTDGQSSRERNINLNELLDYALEKDMKFGYTYA